MKSFLTNYRFRFLFLLLILPIAIWGQLSVKTSQSYDMGVDDDIKGIDQLLVIEHIDGHSSLRFDFEDSTQYQWFFHVPQADSSALSAMLTDTVATVALNEEGVYQLSTSDTSLYFAVIDHSRLSVYLDSVWVDDRGDSCNTLQLYATLAVRDTFMVFSPLQDKEYPLMPKMTYFKWENTSEAEGSPLRIAAPFQDTVYVCHTYGDDFFTPHAGLVNFYHPDTLATEKYEAKAVSLGDLLAELAEDDKTSNELAPSDETEGSAPLDVTYSITPSPSVDYMEWWVWDVDQEQPNASIYPFQEDITYTFLKYVPNGYRIKVEVSNQYCTVSDSLSIKVYESALDAPNIMVLDGSFGKYKVAYQSIDPDSFRATIYDRLGRRIYQWRDPAGGWDGRSPVTQSFVAPGVYYCAVKARGTDGKKHDDIFEITAIKQKR